MVFVPLLCSLTEFHSSMLHIRLAFPKPRPPTSLKSLHCFLFLIEPTLGFFPGPEGLSTFLNEFPHESRNLTSIKSSCLLSLSLNVSCQHKFVPATQSVWNSISLSLPLSGKQNSNTNLKCHLFSMTSSGSGPFSTLSLWPTEPHKLQVTLYLVFISAINVSLTGWDFELRGKKDKFLISQHFA